MSSSTSHPPGLLAKANRKLLEVKSGIALKISQWHLHARDTLLFIPLVGLLAAVVGHKTDNVDAMLLAAEACGLLAALTVSAIGAAFATVTFKELEECKNRFSYGPYGCLSSDSESWVPLDYVFDLSTTGLGSLTLGTLTFVMAICAVLAAAAIKANPSHNQRKRWWRWMGPYMFLMYLFLTAAVTVAGWYFGALLLIKYPHDAFDDLCASNGWVPTGEVRAEVAVHHCTGPTGEVLDNDECAAGSTRLFYSYYGPARADNLSYLSASFGCASITVLIILLLYLGLSFIYMKTDGGLNEDKEGVRLFKRHMEKWAGLNWAALDFLQSHPDQLRQFLQEVSKNDPSMTAVERANLIPMLLDDDFVKEHDSNLGNKLVSSNISPGPSVAEQQEIELVVRSESERIAEPPKEAWHIDNPVALDRPHEEA